MSNPFEHKGAERRTATVVPFQDNEKVSITRLARWVVRLFQQALAEKNTDTKAGLLAQALEIIKAIKRRGGEAAVAVVKKLQEYFESIRDELESESK